MLDNTNFTYDITCENKLNNIEKQLFEKSQDWVKDVKTKNDKIRYLKKYNELSMIEINYDKNNYSVLVPFTDVNFRLYFKEKSVVKMMNYINKYT
jgi:hypothetical protein